MKKKLFELLKGSFVYGIGGALNSILSLLLLPFFTSYLTPEQYGILAVLTIGSTLSLHLFSVGIGISFGICYFDKSNDQKNYKESLLGSSLVLLVITSVIMLVFGVLFIDKLGVMLFDSNKFNNFIIYSLIFNFFSILILPLMQKLQFDERKWAFVLVTLLMTVLTIVINVLLVVLFKLELFGVVLGNMIGKGIAFIIALIFVYYKDNFSFSIIIAFKLLKNGLPIIPSGYILFVLQQGNIFFIKNEMSLEMSGIYSVGYSLGSTASLVVSAFSTAWFPFHLSFKNKLDEASNLFGKITLFYLSIMSLITLLFYVFAEIIVILFTEESFGLSFQIIGITATYYMIYGFQTLTTPAMYFNNKQKIVSLFQFIGTIIYLIIIKKFIRFFGIVGASYAVCISYLIINLLILNWNRTKQNYFKTHYDFKKIITLSISYIIVVFLYYYLMGESWKINILINIVIFILFTTLIFFVILKDERYVLKDFIKNIFISKKSNTNNQS